MGGEVTVRFLLLTPFLAWAALCCALGCRGKEDQASFVSVVTWAGPEAPTTEQRTPGGVAVMVPEWLDRFPELRAEAFAEVDAQGPALWGWTMVIHEPGAFYVRESPTGLARGLVVYAPPEVHVAWRVAWAEDRPLLPALAHEVGHIIGGPGAGH